MALNVTKILFRRGTDAQRKTVNFDQGEPAYSYDTNRLFIGDGQTFGGRPLGMKNLGYVDNITGNYLATGLSMTAFNAVTANSGQVGDIIYDHNTTYLWALTSTSNTPALSNFAPYVIEPTINTSDFFYDSSTLQLTLNNSAIKPKHIDVGCIDSTYFKGGNTTPSPTKITLNPNSVGNDRLTQMGPNTVKVNDSGNAVATAKDLTIGTPCTVLGRGAGNIAPVVLQATAGSNDVTVTASLNTINFYSQPALKLAGGTMAGPINIPNDSTKLISSPYTPAPENTANQSQLINKAYADALPSVKQAQVVYNYVNSTFLPIAGGEMSGDLYIRNAGLYIIGAGGGRLAYSNGGPDINFGFPSRGSSTSNRAFVADQNNVLTLNYASDFDGGVRVASKLNVYGNVGIGSSFTNGSNALVSPAAMLHLNGNNYAAIYLGNNTANKGFHITKESDTGNTYANTLNFWSGAFGSGTNRFKMYQDGTTLLAPQGGNVGVGYGATTTSFTHKFNVYGNIWNTGNLYVSMGNATGGGIVLSDDGDIVDLNDAYCSMRFTAGVRVYNQRSGGQPAITLGSSGDITTQGVINVNQVFASGLGSFSRDYVAGGVQIGVVNQGFYGDNYNVAVRTPPRNAGALDWQGIYFQNYSGQNTHMFIRASDGNTGIGASASGYKLEVGGDVALSWNRWFRTRGEAGWYSETYGGGWYMYDYSYIRNYNNKQLYIFSSNGPSTFDTWKYETGLYIWNYNNNSIGSDAYRGNPGLEIISGGNSRGGGAAHLNFHRPGQYAVRFGLDTDNQLKVGGWSMGAIAYTIHHDGNAGRCWAWVSFNPSAYQGPKGSPAADGSGAFPGYGVFPMYPPYVFSYYNIAYIARMSKGVFRFGFSRNAPGTPCVVASVDGRYVNGGSHCAAYVAYPIQPDYVTVQVWAPTNSAIKTDPGLMCVAVFASGS